MNELGLFVAGLVLSAASEVDFDTFIKIWDQATARAWEHFTREAGWRFQSFTWGDPN